MNITFRQLRVFVEVAERGSMNRSAAALHLTPPAVSMQIKEIETQVGLSLFIRGKRGLLLSPAGERFVVHARHLLATLKEAENDMAGLKQLDRDVLTIGIASTAEYFIPQLLALFREDHPGIHLGIRVARSRKQLIRMMDADEIDLCVMAGLPEDRAAHAEIFASNPYVFVCAPQHPLLRGGSLHVQALDQLQFIAREQGTGARAAMESFLTKHRCAAQICMEAASTQTIKQSVMAGVGLGFLSLECIGLELSNGLLQVLDIPDTPVMGVWSLVHLESKKLPPAAQAFRTFILENAAEHLRAHDANLLSVAFKGRAPHQAHDAAA